ncbi:MAG: adenylyltransferase/cytidyltransferase family protein [Alphaproteobacteria bacterium]
MKRTIFPGSFDPFTRGHFAVLCKAFETFDEVIIAIGVNDEKKSLFSAEKRKELILSSLADFFYGNCQGLSIDEQRVAKDYLDGKKSIKVDVYDGLLVDFCLKVGVYNVTRGVRQGDDDYEHHLLMTNKALARVRGFDFRQTYISLRWADHISSSTVKKLFEFGEYVAAMDYVSPSVHNVMSEMYLENYPAFSDIVPQFLDVYRKRQYHNFSHLAYCMNYLNIARRQVDVKDWVRFGLAILFHDYVMGEGDDERKSAEFVANRIPYPTMTNERIRYTTSLIMATEHSEERDWEGDEAIMHDIDLVCLADEKNSQMFTKLIRKEYPEATDEEFAEGRKAFFEGMLKRNSIFKHEFFISRFEETARENIKKMIALL